ncbi:hypothetical protein, partial [Burkholderia sp. SIMBA_048]|uniref:hypothetical protein n=1 Tax=Burkholderia sp. SIMBA_048 TaxID=3085789 RepID=UPI003978583B
VMALRHVNLLLAEKTPRCAGRQFHVVAVLAVASRQDPAMQVRRAGTNLSFANDPLVSRVKN